MRLHHNSAPVENNYQQHCGNNYWCSRAPSVKLSFAKLDIVYCSCNSATLVTKIDEKDV